MPQSVSVLEYGHLRRRVDGGELSDAAFNWLRAKTISQSDDISPFLSLATKGGKESLRVQNYVGVISTPDGTVIEVLPKHTGDGAGLEELQRAEMPPKHTSDDAGEEELQRVEAPPKYTSDDTGVEKSQKVEESRKLLWKMLRVVYDIPWRSATEANLDTHKKPLPELLVAWFLHTVSHLVRRGIRSDYQRVSDQRKFLKGRLDLSRQLRLPPSKATDFCINFDAYTANRPENRLIKSALEKVSRWPLSVANSRLVKEFSIAFANVEASENIAADFSHWRSQRDMAHYQPVRPWLELILKNRSPWLFSGGWRGISMLFPMEWLFEQYLERVLLRRLAGGYRLIGQAASHYLAQHGERGIFQMRPDLLVKQGSSNFCVMDAKWKLLDENAREAKYNLSQADFYQLFAYGHKYLGGEGDMLLIFPKHTKFEKPLDAFHLSGNPRDISKQSGGLRLWVVPFDLDNDELILPDGLELGCFAQPQTQAA